MGWLDVRHHYQEDEDCRPVWRDLSSSTHTARTPKTCQLCEGAIQPGQRYAKLVALDEGRFTVLCTHEDKDVCRAERAAYEQAMAERERLHAAQCPACGRTDRCQDCVAF